MAGELNGKRIAFLATDGVEQVELTEPWKAVEQAGGAPVLVSTKDGKIQGVNHMDKADIFAVDVTAPARGRHLTLARHRGAGPRAGPAPHAGRVPYAASTRHAR